jgi:alpha-L-fucosidase
VKNKVGQIILIGVGLLGFVSCKNTPESKDKSKELTFEETWESLSTNEREPEWFKDAKFGIYFHWGVYSVPAFDN